MSGIQQSGLVTPGHLAGWLAPGVLGDSGAPVGGKITLGALLGANFNTVNDQPITIRQNTLVFQITQLIVTNASISLTTAVGGFYPQPAKAGTAIVANSQVYSGLTTPTTIINPTLAGAAGFTRFSSANLGTINGLMQIWLSLTTPQGAAASADVYIVGIDIT